MANASGQKPRPILGQGFLEEFAPVDLRILGEAQALGKRSSEAWPSYDFSTLPILIHASKAELLFNHPNPPTGFSSTNLSGTDMTTHLTTHPVVMGMGGNAVQLAETPTLAIPAFRFYPEFWKGLSEQLQITTAMSIDYMISIFIHEGFHAWQMEKNSKKIRFPMFSDYPEYSPWNNAMKNLESRLLHAAFSEPKRLRKHIRDFLLIRIERRSRLTREQIELENKWEYQEGTATYVQLRALQSDREGRKSPLSGLPLFHDYRAPDLLAPLLEPMLRAAEKARGNLSLPAYPLGLGQCLALDKLSPGWKETIWKDGVWLDEILADTLGISMEYGSRKHNNDAIKKRHRFRSLLDTEKAFCGDLWDERRRTYERFLKKPGLRITVELGEFASKVGHMFIQADTTRVTDKALLIKSGLMLLTRDMSLRMHAKGIPVVFEQEAGRCVFILPPDSAKEIEIAGASGARSPEEQSVAINEKAQVTAPGLELIAPSLRWERKDGGVTIHIQN